MEGEMKKVIDFLKEPLAFPILILGVIYIFWLFTTPMDIPRDDNFSNYFAGLKIVVIYIFLTILAKAASTNWKWSVLFIGIMSYPIYWATIFIWFVVSEAEFFDWHQGKLFFTVGMLLATIYPVIALLTKPAYKNRKLSLLLFFVMLSLLGSSISYPLYFYPTKFDEARLGNYKYYLYSIIDWDNHSWQALYKCPAWNFSCEELTGSYSAPGWEIFVDEKTKEVRLLGMYNTLKYTEGAVTHWYGFEGLATLQDITYALQYYEEDETRRFLLNKCLTEMPDSCTVIPLDFSMPGSNEELETIIENANTNELYILSEQQIRFVYGRGSAGYRHLDSLQVADTAESYIYSFERGDVYSYFLYGCEREYSCWSMPFAYSTAGQEEADLQYDEKTDKLLVTVGNKPIFTYKGIINGGCYDGWCSDMQCFVDDCEFWEKE